MLQSKIFMDKGFAAGVVFGVQHHLVELLLFVFQFFVKVFLVQQPFGQIRHGPDVQHEPGTGLGLPLVQSMMELHGGELEMTSKPGRGTTARLVFPSAIVIKRYTKDGGDGSGSSFIFTGA